MAVRRSATARHPLALFTLIVAAGSVLLAGSGPLRAASGTSGIRIVLSGYGDVKVSGGGVNYTCTNAEFGGGSCRGPSVPTGTVLTLTAAPAPIAAPGGFDPAPDPSARSQFVGWSRPECTTAGPCTVTTAAEDEWVVAQFSPVWLEVIKSGTGTVSVDGAPPLKCRTDGSKCTGLFPAGTSLTVRGRPTPAPADWVFGCDPYESDLSGGRCVVAMSNLRNFVIVGFGGPPFSTTPPFNLVSELVVERSGDGQGQVQGDGRSAESAAPPWKIDCGSLCVVKSLQYQTRVRLRAVAGADSQFDGWAGPPCLSEQTCTFTVGKYPKVTAKFKKIQPPEVKPFRAAVLTAAATGANATRVVVARLRTNGTARTTLRLLRNGRTLSRKSFDVAAGTRRLTLPVPSSVKPGWCALSVEITGADGAKRTFRKWLRLGA